MRGEYGKKDCRAQGWPGNPFEINKNPITAIESRDVFNQLHKDPNLRVGIITEVSDKVFIV